MFAIIETGGKQYKVTPGQKIKIEKLEVPEGDVVIFDKVLLKSDDANTAIGAPHIPGATVSAKVLKQGRSRKVIVFKYSSKTRYRKKKGHRQHFTEVAITAIK
jgi:large subunit ribosomal protein L21